MKGLKKAVKMIRQARDIAITCHVNPDGDAIGSMLSLGLGLEKLGKKVYMVSRDGVPKKYRRLRGARRVRKRLDKKVDLGVTVDCSTAEMVGGVFTFLERTGSILEVDHHEIRAPFGDAQLIDTRAAAVGEMVYVLLKRLGVKPTKDIAENILTSLIVETCSFRLPNVTPFTFKVCEAMLRAGVDFYRLVDTVYWSHTREVAVLSGVCMSRLKFAARGRLAWSVIKREDFHKAGGKDEDVDAVPDEIRAIKGVDIAVLFRETDRHSIRVSLRSKGGINVAKLAALFGGGGHADVSGCRIPNRQDSMKKLLARARELL